jgi:hypothetical protein
MLSFPAEINRGSSFDDRVWDCQGHLRFSPNRQKVGT